MAITFERQRVLAPGGGGGGVPVAITADFPILFDSVTSTVSHADELTVRHVTDLQVADWDSKAPAIHSHVIDDVDGLRLELDNRIQPNLVQMNKFTLFENLTGTHIISSDYGPSDIEAINNTLNTHSGNFVTIDGQISNLQDGINNRVRFVEGTFGGSQVGNIPMYDDTTGSLVRDSGQSVQGLLDAIGGKEPTQTKGNLTATGPIAVSATRQVIGGAVTVSHVDNSSVRHVTDAEKSTWNAKQSAIAEGTSGQFYSWDKTMKSVDWSHIANVPSGFTPSAHNHDAGHISSGILDVDRVPTIPRSKLSGVNFSTGRYLRWTGSEWANGIITDNGTNIGVGTAADVNFRFKVNGTSHFGADISCSSITSGSTIKARDLSATLLGTDNFINKGAIGLKSSLDNVFASWHSANGTRVGYVDMGLTTTAKIYVESNQALSIGTNNNERLRVLADGEVQVLRNLIVNQEGSGVGVIVGKRVGTAYHLFDSDLTEPNILYLRARNGLSRGSNTSILDCHEVRVNSLSVNGAITTSLSAGVVSSDANGTLSSGVLDVSSISASGITANRLLRRTSSGWASSVVRDNGTNIGIGTDPVSGQRLTVGGLTHVEGAVRSQGDSQNATFTNHGQIALKRSTGSPYLSFHQDNGGRLGYLMWRDSANARIQTDVAQGIELRTGGENTRVTIQADGNTRIHNNLGIGTAPVSGVRANILGMTRLNGAVERAVLRLTSAVGDVSNPLILNNTHHEIIYWPPSDFDNSQYVRLPSASTCPGREYRFSARFYADGPRTAFGSFIIQTTNGASEIFVRGVMLNQIYFWQDEDIFYGDLKTYTLTVVSDGFNWIAQY